jgi:hypothetical protein
MSGVIHMPRWSKSAAITTGTTIAPITIAACGITTGTAVTCSGRRPTITIGRGVTTIDRSIAGVSIARIDALIVLVRFVFGECQVLTHGVARGLDNSTAESRPTRGSNHGQGIVVAVIDEQRGVVRAVETPLASRNDFIPLGLANRAEGLDVAGEKRGLALNVGHIGFRLAGLHHRLVVVNSLLSERTTREQHECQKCNEERTELIDFHVCCCLFATRPL